MHFDLSVGEECNWARHKKCSRVKLFFNTIKLFGIKYKALVQNVRHCKV